MIHHVNHYDNLSIYKIFLPVVLKDQFVQLHYIQIFFLSWYTESTFLCPKRHLELAYYLFMQILYRFTFKGYFYFSLTLLLFLFLNLFYSGVLSSFRPTWKHFYIFTFITLSSDKSVLSNIFS